MKLSDFSVDRPIAITMFVLLVVLIGAVGFTELGVQLMPELELPFVVVQTQYNGATPEEVEDSVTKTLEETVATVEGLDTISSTSRENMSTIFLEFNWDIDVDNAKADVRDKIDMVKDALPDGADEPVIMQFDPANRPVVKIALSGPNLTYLKDLAEDKFQTQLETISGVASVDMKGELSREIQIRVKQEKMNAYGLTFNDISSGIKSSNLDMSVGEINDGVKELTVKGKGEFDSVEEIRNIQLITANGRQINLSDVAVVRDTHSEIAQYSYLNGKRSITLGVKKQNDANTVEVADAVKKRVEELKQNVPGNIDVKVISDSSEFIKDSIASVQQNFMTGGILAVIILFLFLRNVRTTVVISTAIPTSVIATLGMMYFGDLSLNNLTLGGLSLGIGMLLDNSVVVLENIYRHHHEGLGRIQAAKEGAAEVGMAIFASTMTTVIVFLPMIFVDGIAGEIFTPMSKTIAFSLLASLLVALTFIPMLSSKLLRVEIDEEKNKQGKVTKTYKSILCWCLNRRYLIAGSLIVILVLFGFGLIKGYIPLQTEFFPKSDRGKVNVYFELAQGTQLDKTNQFVMNAKDNINEIPEIKDISSEVGSNNNSYEGEIEVDLVDLAKRERGVTKVAEVIRTKLNDLAGAKINVVPQTSMMGRQGKGGGAITINVKGLDLDTLLNLANEIETKVENTEGTRNIAITPKASKPELEIIPRENLAKEMGITKQQLFSTIDTAVDGSDVSKYKEDGEEYDIRLKLFDEESNSINQLLNIKINSPQGGVVPLSQIADMRYATGPNAIEREEQERKFTIGTDTYQRSLGAVLEDIKTKLGKMDLPEGYSINYKGDAGDMRESFQELGQAMIMAIVLVYMVMAAQFESLVHPFVIMFTVPISLIGAITALVVTGIPLSINGFIGIIMLVGIVVNNGIVLVDYINTRREFEDREEAILNAGPIRLRPVLMTASTTMLAMVPLALGIGAGAEMQQAMAIVVIGGLLLATFLTLVIVPVIYDIMEDLSAVVSGFFRKLLHGEEPQQPSNNESI
ncbi:efflux RND transporter permease subunit [Halanaerobacter jeridensis]|uniref:HAE1 family hydrophobic/amphiphilic exporter-1 n=1 Tax=Halanaerobacter jeridensis TaxID=706427 RepID=A0A938XQ57_9FIRM|nr:efflux RND transporter permease subunit [Halanaerobacter jeridensis]MBM7557337.1 HAE1 family hydrophobic/amphiphilic exporter-1 [Halanaerobacter jeridensis]